MTFERTLIMGVINVTPDSFSDGGLYVDTEVAIARAKEMVAQGADIIDVGGESTRPGAKPVTFGEELNRIKPVIQRLAPELNIPISVDTYKPQVAQEAIKAGATIINDISGLTDKKMIRVSADNHAPVVLMHMKGTPQNMQENPVYNDVVSEVIAFLKERLTFASDMGVQDMIVDPGIGFGKTVENNLQILRNLSEFRRLKRPILVGPSRKSFIGKLTGLPPSERLEGTLAVVAVASLNGANIVRVHDVVECKRVLQVVDAIRGA